MDIPILKYVDVLIGLAVVMILASTVVTAVCQVALKSSYTRARVLRAGLQELIAHLDGPVNKDTARYVAERLMRHPLLGRPNSAIGRLGNRIRGVFRRNSNALPLPPIDPAGTVLREEFIVILLEWASHQGPLANQDAELGTRETNAATPATATTGDPKTIEKDLRALREGLREAFVRNGIPDPAGTLSAIRRQMLENEKNSPDLPSTRWRNDAILAVASSEGIAKVHGWFDNMSERISDRYAFQARVLTSIVALAVCISIQLDSISLLRRLSADDKLRDSLVVQAKDLQKQRDDADKQADAKKAEPAVDVANLRNDADRANEELREIQQTLSQMREPKLSLVPSYLAWEKVAMAQAPAPGKSLPVSETPPLQLSVGNATYPIVLGKPEEGQILSRLNQAILKSGAPVDIYNKDDHLLLAAKTTDVRKISLMSGTGPLSSDLGAQRNYAGLMAKGTGIFLSWILLTLGAPFWYDVLKNGLNLRSRIAQKDEKDRVARQTETPRDQPKSGAAATGGTA